VSSKYRFLQIFIVLGVIGALVVGFYVSRMASNQSSGPSSDTSNNGDNLEATGENAEPGMFRTGFNLGGIPEYVFTPTNPMTLVSLSVVPGTKITEQVWGFRLKDKDYRFRNFTAVCIIDSGTVGENLANLEIDTEYRLLFAGVERPFSESSIVGELTPDCKTVWDLRGDPDDMTRLKNFFTDGKSEGFGINGENGIIDLTNVVVLFQTVKQ